MLDSLTVGTETLVPTFAGNVYDYACTAEGGTAALSASVEDATKASMVIEFTSDDGEHWETVSSGSTVSFMVGSSNRMRVTTSATGEGHGPGHVYTVSISYAGPPASADLVGLDVSEVGGTLTPSFDAGVTSYVLAGAYMGHAISEIVATAEDAGATIAVTLDGVAVTNSTVIGDYGTAYDAEDPQAGQVSEFWDDSNMTASGTLVFTVTNGATTKAYTVTMVDSIPDVRVIDLVLSAKNGAGTAGDDFAFTAAGGYDADKFGTYVDGTSYTVADTADFIQQTVLENMPSGFTGAYSIDGYVTGRDGSPVGMYANGGLASVYPYTYVNGSNTGTIQTGSTPYSSIAAVGENVFGFGISNKKYDDAPVLWYVFDAKVEQSDGSNMLTALSVGGSSITLDPTFDTDKFWYECQTGDASNMITATASSGATGTEIQEMAANSSTWVTVTNGRGNWDAGINEIRVRAYTESGETTTYGPWYHVEVEKVGNSTLASVDFGELSGVVSPAFDPATTEYAVNLTGQSTLLTTFVTTNNNEDTYITIQDPNYDSIVALDDECHMFSDQITYEAGDYTVTVQYGLNSSSANRTAYTFTVTV